MHGWIVVVVETGGLVSAMIFCSATVTAGSPSLIPGPNHGQSFHWVGVGQTQHSALLSSAQHHSSLVPFPVAVNGPCLPRSKPRALWLWLWLWLCFAVCLRGRGPKRGEHSVDRSHSRGLAATKQA